MKSGGFPPIFYDKSIFNSFPSNQIIFGLLLGNIFLTSNKFSDLDVIYDSSNGPISDKRQTPLESYYTDAHNGVVLAKQAVLHSDRLFAATSTPLATVLSTKYLKMSNGASSGA